MKEFSLISINDTIPQTIAAVVISVVFLFLLLQIVVRMTTKDFALKRRVLRMPVTAWCSIFLITGAALTAGGSYYAHIQRDQQMLDALTQGEYSKAHTVLNQRPTYDPLTSFDFAVSQGQSRRMVLCRVITSLDSKHYIGCQQSSPNAPFVSYAQSVQ